MNRTEPVSWDEMCADPNTGARRILSNQIADRDERIRDVNRTIWKAELAVADVQQIQVPSGAELLCAREQHEKICVWFRCDPSAATEPRKIAVVGTDHPAPADGRYIGTASLMGGQLIFHVFAWPN